MAEWLVFLLYVSALAAVGLGVAAWFGPRRPSFVWPALAWPVVFLQVLRFSLIARPRGGTGMDYEYEWVLMPALLFWLPATFIVGAAGAAWLLRGWQRLAAIVLLIGAVLTVVAELRE